MHPLLTELEARHRIDTRHREAEAWRRVRLAAPRRTWRARLGGLLVRTGHALEGKAPRPARPVH